MTQTLVENALSYAAHGWPVLPVQASGKIALIKEWQLAASVDPEVIKEWWKKWPGANVGILTGEKSGLFVLDVDIDEEKGIDGNVALAELEKKYGKLPHTIESITGRGGRHILFKHPGFPVKTCAGQLGKDLDVRGEGGYFVAPPSVHVSRKKYAWELSCHPNDTPLADSPAWLLNHLKNLSTKKDNAICECGEIDEKIPEGRRNDQLMRFAGRLRGNGLSRDEILPALLKINACRCVPPLSEFEVTTIANSASRYAPAPSGGSQLPLADLKAAKACVTKAIEKAAGGDSGAPFEKDALEAFKILRHGDPANYARERAELKKTKNVKLSDLEEMIGALKEPKEEGAAEKKSIEKLFPEITLWPEPVDAEALLNEITSIIQRHVILDTYAANAVTLWCAATWFIDVIDYAPLLNLSSPEKRCGKTTLLALLTRLVRRPLAAANITAAVLYRLIEKFHPTMLIDEADSFLPNNEELRGILNSGHTRENAYVPRCVGDDHDPQLFSTWGFKSLSGIGRIQATLEDRSIIIPLRRKLPGEKIERLRLADPNLFEELRSKLARLANDHQGAIKTATPDVPDSLSDRAADNWEPLLAIANLGGEEWVRRGEKAAKDLSGVVEDSGLSVRLLVDIKNVFDEEDVDKISTKALIVKLEADEELGWSTYNRGKPISPKQLANRLKAFGISSVNIGDTRLKGYRLTQFEDVFNRYLPTTKHSSRSSAQNGPTTGNNECSPRADESKHEIVRAEEKLPNCLKNNEMSVRADRNGVKGELDRDTTSNDGHAVNSNPSSDWRDEQLRATLARIGL